jgi:hypothetical protein
MEEDALLNNNAGAERLKCGWLRMTRVVRVCGTHLEIVSRRNKSTSVSCEGVRRKGSLGFRIGPQLFYAESEEQLRRVLCAMRVETGPLSCWMTSLPDAVLDAPWTRLILPGDYTTANVGGRDI